MPASAVSTMFGGSAGGEVRRGGHRRESSLFWDHVPNRLGTGKQKPLARVGDGAWVSSFVPIAPEAGENLSSVMPVKTPIVTNGSATDPLPPPTPRFPARRQRSPSGKVGAVKRSRRSFATRTTLDR